MILLVMGIVALARHRTAIARQVTTANQWGIPLGIHLLFCERVHTKFTAARLNSLQSILGVMTNLRQHGKPQQQAPEEAMIYRRCSHYCFLQSSPT